MTKYSVSHSVNLSISGKGKGKSEVGKGWKGMRGMVILKIFLGSLCFVTSFT